MYNRVLVYNIGDEDINYKMADFSGMEQFNPHFDPRSLAIRWKDWLARFKRCLVIFEEKGTSARQRALSATLFGWTRSWTHFFNPARHRRGRWLSESRKQSVGIFCPKEKRVVRKVRVQTSKPRSWWDLRQVLYAPLSSLHHMWIQRARRRN